MADAHVKGLRQRFEQTDNMSGPPVRGKKPGVATKPVLQRFQQQDNPAPSSSSKPGAFQAPVKLAGFPDISSATSKLKPTGLSTTASNDNNTNDKSIVKGISNVSKAFQNGNINSNNDRNNNTNGSTNGNLSSSSNSSSPASLKSPRSNFNANDNKSPLSAKVALKPVNSLTKAGSQPNKQSLKPPNFSNNQNAHTKTDSTSSSTSSSSSSSSALSSSANDKSTPSSQSSVNGAFDLKSLLRPVNTSSLAPPVKKVLAGVNEPAPTSPKGAPLSPSSPSSPPASNSTSSPTSPTQPLKIPPIPSNDKIQMRQKRNESSNEIVMRKSDGKKFRKLSMSTSKSTSFPPKPTAPNNIDLSFIREEYEKITDKPDTPIEDVEYFDGMTVQSFLPPPPKQNLPPVPPPKIQTPSERASQRISLIPDMTAEEEEGIDMPVYDDTPIEEEEDVYDDAESERVNKSVSTPKTSKSSVSSECQSPLESEQDKKKRLKKEEKERKMKEKKEKEDEKQRKRKEDEERKLKEKFKLTGNEKIIGEGIIKQDCKASGQNLRVKTGQTVTILRLHSNPPNKWLVKADSQIGFVESNNIEVDKNIIRQATEAMTNQIEDDDQPTYDDVPGEFSCPNSPVPIDEEPDEIYELCS